jgi:hypothetical protein
MPTPPLSDDLAQEALDALEAFGGRAKAAAESMGINLHTFRNRVRVARERGFHLPEGVRDALARTGLTHGSARRGWRRVKDPDTGSFNSVYWDTKADAESVLERIRDAMHDIPTAPPVALDAVPDADLLNLIAIADAHIGMMSYGRETGEDWDTKKGAARLTEWVGQALSRMPPAQRCVILVAGDLLHADDQTSETPASRHKLDVDTRHFRTLEVTIEAIACSVDTALRTHESVTLRCLPGNHDPHASMAVLLAMFERYRNEPRVTVQREPSEFFVYQFGKVLLTAHHGHRAKAPQMVHFIADEYAPLWGKTRFRYLFTGHLHHHKSQDIGGMTWEQLPAITSRDAYAVSSAYTQRARMKGITYHRDRGEVSRVVVGAE